MEFINTQYDLGKMQTYCYGLDIFAAEVLSVRELSSSKSTINANLQINALNAQENKFVKRSLFHFGNIEISHHNHSI